MTTLSILGGDWLLNFDDENVSGTAGLRKLEYVTGIVRTTNEVYSDVAANADEFQAMGFRNPMLPVTPNAYTMENDYFIPRSSAEQLKEGAVTANWAMKTVTSDTNGHGVIKVEWVGGTGPASGDIGREVVQAGTGDAGCLVDFDVDPDGTTVIWVRPIDSTPSTGDTFDGSGALTVSGGTLSSTTSVAGISGITQWSAIQAIGSVPTATEVYLLQDRIKMVDSTGGFQWWTTDTTVSLGIISILIQVINSGVTIAAGDVEVFARRYTSLYDNFRLNVIAGGFQALPLSSAPDINNTTGNQRFTSTGATGTGTFVVGEIANEAVSGAAIVITDVAGDSADPILQYYIVGDLTDIFSSGAQTITGVTSLATVLSEAVVANLLGPTDGASGEGGTVTVTLGSFEVDHDGDGNTERYSAQVDSQGPGGSGVSASKTYERMKFITRRGADAAILFGAGTNVPGETYRGMEIVAEINADIVAWTEGDDLDIVAKSGFSARSMSNQGANTPPYVTIMDIQTSLESIEDNDEVRDEGTDTVVVENGAGATLFFAGSGGGIEATAVIKFSPFCSFTGTVIFGARGISFINPADADTQNYILIDDLGNQRTPPNTVTFTVSNTLALDRVLVARDTGVDGVIDKDQFGGMTAVAQSSKTITIAGAIDSEVPSSSAVRVVETTLQQEHHYVYDSITGTTVFNLRDITADTAAGATSDTLLNKSGGASFITEDVVPGMLIFVTARTSTYEVVTRTDADNLVIRLLYGAGGFTSGDTYIINETIQLYATGDDIFDLILDVEATGTTTSNSFVQSTTFDVVVNVRQGKIILPFTQNSPVTTAGGSSTVVRQPDTIAT